MVIRPSDKHKRQAKIMMLPSSFTDSSVSLRMNIHMGLRRCLPKAAEAPACYSIQCRRLTLVPSVSLSLSFSPLLFNSKGKIGKSRVKEKKEKVLNYCISYGMTYRILG